MVRHQTPRAAVSTDETFVLLITENKTRGFHMQWSDYGFLQQGLIRKAVDFLESPADHLESKIRIDLSCPWFALQLHEMEFSEIALSVIAFVAGNQLRREGFGVAMFIDILSAGKIARKTGSVSCKGPESYRSA